MEMRAQFSECNQFQSEAAWYWRQTSSRFPLPSPFRFLPADPDQDFVFDSHTKRKENTHTAMTVWLLAHDWLRKEGNKEGRKEDTQMK